MRAKSKGLSANLAWEAKNYHYASQKQVYNSSLWGWGVGGTETPQGQSGNLAICWPPIPLDREWFPRLSASVQHPCVGHSLVDRTKGSPRQYFTTNMNSCFARWRLRALKGRALSQSPAPSLARHWSCAWSLVLTVLPKRAALTSLSTTKDSSR